MCKGALRDFFWVWRNAFNAHGAQSLNPERSPGKMPDIFFTSLFRTPP
jgi:hypothetical protein